MSRFERRLKPEKYNSRSLNNSSGSSNRSASPRPGTATCKLRTKPQKMLSGFITVKEKQSNNQELNNTISDATLEKKVIIEEVASTNIVETQDDIIDRTMMINEQLKISMTRTKNPTLKKLLAHELRLNTIELNLDCLTNLKCSEVSKTQENDSELRSIEDTIIKVNTFDQLTKELNLENENINKRINQFEDIQKNVQNSCLENIEDIKNVKARINVLDEITKEIEEIKEKSNNDDHDLIKENKIDMLRQEITYLKENKEQLENNINTMVNFINELVRKLNDEQVVQVNEIFL